MVVTRGGIERSESLAVLASAAKQPTLTQLRYFVINNNGVRQPKRQSCAH
jgi:hypothetical protein